SLLSLILFSAVSASLRETLTSSHGNFPARKPHPSAIVEVAHTPAEPRPGDPRRLPHAPARHPPLPAPRRSSPPTASRRFGARDFLARHRRDLHRCARRLARLVAPLARPGPRPLPHRGTRFGRDHRLSPPRPAVAPPRRRPVACPPGRGRVSGV